jgi:formylglycine-generating enzyme required for sulfatase activity
MSQKHCKFVPATAILILSGWMATGWAQEMAIRSFDSTGQLTFNRIATGQAYRVECATSLTGAWTRLTNAVTIDGIPTTMDCIPGKDGIVTGAVPMQASAMFFRAVADTNDMVLILAGEFVMGATTNMGHEYRYGDTPQHIVYVSAFYIGRYEVTKATWDNVCTWAATNSYTDLLQYSQVTNKGPAHPIVRLGWYTAAKWCNARSEMEGLTPCYTNANGAIFRTGYTDFQGEVSPISIGCDWSANGYRFPTEAEWEKAARGGVSGHRFAWSDVDTIQQTRANYYASTNRSGLYISDTNPTAGYHPAYTNGGTPYTSPVGSFAPNGYGLYDLVGNASEWCWDWNSETYYSTSPRIDPRGPPQDPFNHRLIRGGGYSDFAWGSFVGAYRGCDVMSDNRANVGVGIRIARSFTNMVANQAPVIAEGASTNVTMSEDSAPMPFSLTLHATDADGDPIGWWVPTPASNGIATVSGRGTSMPIAYQPPANYTGSDSFVVQAYDTWGAKTSITVNVTIQPVNDAPVAYPQTVSVATNTPRAITLTGSDIEGSGLTYVVVNQPPHGALSGTPPNVTYTPDPGYKGSDSFTFTANDGTNDSAPATVTLWLNAMAAQGGTMTNYTANGTNYTAHIFTTVGSNSLVVSAGGAVEVLVVAGGGGGGGGDSTAGGGGGGGAGGLIYTNLVLAAGSYAAKVGAGGVAGGWISDTATQGSNSTFAALTALGGGCGKLRNAGTGGGSGAGGYGKGYAGGAGIQVGGYANSGGVGGPNPGGGGGGGGAGSAGIAGVTNSVGGNGGAGRSYDISGVLTGYAGGGGGGAQVGSGGTATDGGGQGGTRSGTGAVAGSPNTGGGGGGGSYYFGNGVAGGSGIVIVRYGVAVP